MEKATFFDRLAVYRPVHDIVVRKAFCASPLFFLPPSVSCKYALSIGGKVKS